MPARAEFPAEQLATALRFYRQAMREALMDEAFHPVMPAATWVLLSVAREPGTVGQVARRLGTSKQAVSRLAERLVGLGYCDRRRGDSNRRQVLLSVTAEGAEAAAALQVGIEAADAVLMAGLDDREREIFRTVLARVAAASTAAALPLDLE